MEQLVTWKLGKQKLPMDACSLAIPPKPRNDQFDFDFVEGNVSIWSFGGSK